MSGSKFLQSKLTNEPYFAGCNFLSVQQRHGRSPRVRSSLRANGGSAFCDGKALDERLTESAAGTCLRGRQEPIPRMKLCRRIAFPKAQDYAKNWPATK